MLRLAEPVPGHLRGMLVFLRNGAKFGKLWRCGRYYLRNSKVAYLKKFLKERDVNLSGDRKSLAEKVFGAVRLGLETLPTRTSLFPMQVWHTNPIFLSLNILSVREDSESLKFVVKIKEKFFCHSSHVHTFG